MTTEKKLEKLKTLIEDILSRELKYDNLEDLKDELCLTDEDISDFDFLLTKFSVKIDFEEI